LLRFLTKDSLFRFLISSLLRQLYDSGYLLDRPSTRKQL
jgi:hypothetical protein